MEDFLVSIYRGVALFLIFGSFVLIRDTRERTIKMNTKLPCEKEYTKIEYGKGINCKGDTITIFEYSNNPLNKDIPL